MLFASSSMLSRAVTKMEAMELKTAGTLQQCTYFCDPCFSFFLQSLSMPISMAWQVLCLQVQLCLLSQFSLIKHAEFAAYNIIDPVFFLTIAMCYSAVMCMNIAAVKTRNLLKLSFILSFLVGTLPLSCLVVIFVRWICCCRGFGRRLVQNIKSQIRRVTNHACTSALEESLPHRLINPSLYNNDGTCAAFYRASSTEKFSDQAYSSINTDESKKGKEQDSLAHMPITYVYFPRIARITCIQQLQCLQDLMHVCKTLHKLFLFQFQLYYHMINVVQKLRVTVMLFYCQMLHCKATAGNLHCMSRKCYFNPSDVLFIVVKWFLVIQSFRLDGV